jgi:hypothetical protein
MLNIETSVITAIPEKTATASYPVLLLETAIQDVDFSVLLWNCCKLTRVHCSNSN